MGSFARSLTRDLATGAPGGGIGKLDTRIFRHMLLMMGAGSALTAVSIAADSQRDHPYWVSRIGFGFFPFLNYDSRIGQWKIISPVEAFAGPFISDVVRITGTFAELLTNDDARRNFDVQIDNLAEGLSALPRQAGTLFDTSGNVIESIGDMLGVQQAEGVADLIRAQQERLSRLSRPAATIRRGFPKQGGQRRAGGDDPFGSGAAADPFGGGGDSAGF